MLLSISIISLYFSNYYVQDCTVVSTDPSVEAYMVCQTPSLPNLFELTTVQQNFMELDYGFIMDNVTALLKWSEDEGRHYTVFPDPVFEKFVGGVKTFQSGSDFLILSVSCCNTFC